MDIRGNIFCFSDFVAGLGNEYGSHAYLFPVKRIGMEGEGRRLHFYQMGNMMFRTGGGA